MLRAVPWCLLLLALLAGGALAACRRGELEARLTVPPPAPSAESPAESSAELPAPAAPPAPVAAESAERVPVGPADLIADVVDADWSAPTALGLRAREPLAFPALTAGGGAESAAVRSARAAVRRRPTAAGYRKLADACRTAGLYQEAAEAYRKEAALRRKMGDPQAALVEERKAAELESALRLHRREVVRLPRLEAEPAKFEPATGCYVGAIVERDPVAAGDQRAFNQAAGKPHAIFFDYRSYGKPFPSDWAERVKAVGGAVQIAFEPNGGLDAVRDDAYLQGFARAAAAAELPVFLRFAGEMNGDWTRWGGDPRAYIAKFRLVHDVMARLAPNVAMVWAPNAIPVEPIDSFYPGDDYVDWVGLSMYSVYVYNGDPKQSAARLDPGALLKPIYDRYAARKPIFIVEYAATHQCAATGKALPQFAVDKLNMLYGALPRRFPRAKAICWYDIDNTSHAVRAGRALNDFSLTTDATVLAGYAHAVADPYFLSTVVEDGQQDQGVRYPRLADGDALSGTVRLSAWATTWIDRPLLAWRIDGKNQLAVGQRPYDVAWDTTRVSNGKHTLEALVVVDGRVAVRQAVPVMVRN